MLSEVEEAVPQNDVFRSFKSSIEPALVNMHDFTHGGVQSIARQYGVDGNLTNQGNQAERQELLKLALLVSSLSYEKLTPFMSHGRPCEEIYGLVMNQIKL